MISDFQGEGYERDLRQLGRKHDVVALVVQDPLERAWPDLGIVELQDAESGEILTVDTGSAEFQKIFASEIKKRTEIRGSLF